ncbi:MAG TPA: iron uptake transporter permease EfeU [Flexivirga sp.]|uniref:iron uptake transporter permease EfeU n=1 Tax=Flexivirga sp. TaxID=1962927 RepID=UPI002CB7738E|nr:iron uptake transporter permease EfeU [Flexivirga sp.]HWC23940.1 iron uptake transporter permease EfeU [Flexivirga sp.]
MLATFVIGLREGLEAALIVGIVAAFLKKNGHRLTAMWLGVGAGVAISIAVGVALKIIESNLPQRQQEMMETVIGGVAVVFVTGMIIWMSKHSRGLKREIESAAQTALSTGTSRAMVIMAFLAVLKEGFESAVFLLATFQAATNTGSAIAGAALGIGCAVLLGLGLYTGGVSINLGKFFKATSAFLILIAAGLVVSALRTAHEAGWLNAGQQRTVDLHWLAPVGSIRSAVFTGVLGIPADPRLIEVLGWFLFVIPMTLIVFWPAAHRPSAIQSARLKLALAGACVVGAIAAFVAGPSATLSTPRQVPVVDGAGSSAGTIQLNGHTLRTSAGTDIELASKGPAVVTGVRTRHLTGAAATKSSTGAPRTLTLAQVAALNGSRVPVGMDPSVNPGPYQATWHEADKLDVWTSHGRVYDANRTSRTSVTLTGGGLSTARTLTIAPGTKVPAGVTAPAGSWSVAPSYTDDFATQLNQFANDRDSANFWGRVVPLALLVAAAAFVIVALRSRRRPHIAGKPAGGATPHPSRSSAHA